MFRTITNEKMKQSQHVRDWSNKRSRGKMNGRNDGHLTCALNCRKEKKKKTKTKSLFRSHGKNNLKQISANSFFIFLCRWNLKMQL